MLTKQKNSILSCYGDVLQIDIRIIINPTKMLHPAATSAQAIK